MQALDKSKAAKLKRLNAFGKKLARTEEVNAVNNSDRDTANFALGVLNQQFADAAKAMEAPPPTPATQYSQPIGPFYVHGVYQ